MVDRAAEAVDKLASADGPLLAFLRGFDKRWIQLLKPMSLDRNAASEDLPIVVEVEATNHSLNRSVTCVRIPSGSDSLAVDDAGGGRQPDGLHLVKKAAMETSVVTHSPQRLSPQLTSRWRIKPDMQR
jgi:hypothetical protein